MREKRRRLVNSNLTLRLASIRAQITHKCVTLNLNLSNANFQFFQTSTAHRARFGYSRADRLPLVFRLGNNDLGYGDEC